jgi:hypothetical protein
MSIHKPHAYYRNSTTYKYNKDNEQGQTNRTQKKKSLLK